MASKKKIEIILDEYTGIDELSIEDQLLVREAMRASANAYSRYSNFSVGAALKLDTGEIITANNRENASYPVSLCAEHAAIAYAGGNYPGSVIISIAICARKGEEFTYVPVSPCGKCRQVISEEEDRSGKKIRIILYGRSVIYISEGIENLLPLHFSSSDLLH
ncbi:MAG TPA: cytidine deaminase [Bacteroidales bacterium]|nr:cytidine deaminase [Bacteroidales bacterium]